jgi:hypothetical protein
LHLQAVSAGKIQALKRKLSKEEEERITFEVLASLAGLKVIPGSIAQNLPPSPDIECQVEGQGGMAFELVALDAADTRRRLSHWQATRGAWDRALKSWPDKEQELLRGDGGNLTLSLIIHDQADVKARIEIMREIQARLLANGAGFKGHLFEEDDYPEVLERARVFRDDNVINGPQIYAPSGGAWLVPQVDKIREKLTDKDYRTDRPLELIAYATHDELDAHVDSLRMICECVQRHLPGSRFRRVWVFNRHFRQLCYVYPPVEEKKTLVTLQQVTVTCAADD